MPGKLLFVDDTHPAPSGQSVVEVNYFLQSAGNAGQLNRDHYRNKLKELYKKIIDGQDIYINRNVENFFNDKGEDYQYSYQLFIQISNDLNSDNPLVRQAATRHYNRINAKFGLNKPLTGNVIDNQQTTINNQGLLLITEGNNYVLKNHNKTPPTEVRINTTSTDDKDVKKLFNMLYAAYAGGQVIYIDEATKKSLSTNPTFKKHIDEFNKLKDLLAEEKGRYLHTRLTLYDSNHDNPVVKVLTENRYLVNNNNALKFDLTSANEVSITVIADKAWEPVNGHDASNEVVLKRKNDACNSYKAFLGPGGLGLTENNDYRIEPAKINKTSDGREIIGNGRIIITNAGLEKLREKGLTSPFIADAVVNIDKAIGARQHTLGNPRLNSSETPPAPIELNSELKTQIKATYESAGFSPREPQDSSILKFAKTQNEIIKEVTVIPGVSVTGSPGNYEPNEYVAMINSAIKAGLQIPLILKNDNQQELNKMVEAQIRLTYE